MGLGFQAALATAGFGRPVSGLLISKHNSPTVGIMNPSSSFCPVVVRVDAITYMS